VSVIRDQYHVLSSIWRDESNRRERLRRLLFFTGWHVWKRLIRVPIVISFFNGLRFVTYPDCGISSAVVYHRIPDYRNITFLREQAQGGTLLDIGANVGSVSLLLADRIGHALLFEPNPIAARRARENLLLNNLPFEVHEEALSDTAGEIEFEDGGGTSTCNRTVVGFSTSVPTRKAIRVTFDEFVSARGAFRLPVTLVKIDVEGHENAVLRGMEKFLAVQRPRLIMFEYLQRTNLAETLRLFDTVRYCAFELTRSGARLATPAVRPLQDLFACPLEVASQFGLSVPVQQKAMADLSSVVK
jgi:FkbM family methyltransferase